jgi:hypothetical protein
MSYSTIEEAWGENPTTLKGNKKKRNTIRRNSTLSNQTDFRVEEEQPINLDYVDNNNHNNHTNHNNNNINNNMENEYHNFERVNKNKYYHQQHNQGASDMGHSNNYSRGVHNRLSKKNRIARKSFLNNTLDLSINSSESSRKLINNNKQKMIPSPQRNSIPSPVSLNDDYDNYQTLDYETENKDFLNDYANGVQFNNEISNDLDRINNPEFRPINHMNDNLAPYDGGVNGGSDITEDNEQDDYYNKSNSNYEVITPEYTRNNVNEPVDEPVNEPIDDVDEEDNGVEEGFVGHMSKSRGGSRGRGNEGFQNNQNFSNPELAHIMDRLDNLERMIKQKKQENNNVHDIILFIIIGVFILFALDSIFKIGKNTI